MIKSQIFPLPCTISVASLTTLSLTNNRKDFILCSASPCDSVPQSVMLEFSLSSSSSISVELSICISPSGASLELSSPDWSPASSSSSQPSASSSSSSASIRKILTRLLDENSYKEREKQLCFPTNKNHEIANITWKLNIYICVGLLRCITNDSRFGKSYSWFFFMIIWFSILLFTQKFHQFASNLENM